MANQNINPTRMELARVKNKLETARRGHHLLKDKQDEMIRQFMLIINEYKDLRLVVHSELLRALVEFKETKITHTDEEIHQKLMIPAQVGNITFKTSSVMSVKVPKISDYQIKPEITYSIIDSDPSFDKSVSIIGNLFADILRLAQLDKTARLLIEEIEKVKRRVNAIEYIMIPELTESVKMIKMKLSDNERSNTIRIMKSKEIVLKKLTNNKK